MKRFWLAVLIALAPGPNVEAQTLSGGGGGLNVGVSPVLGGCTNGYLLYNNAGVLGCQAAGAASLSIGSSITGSTAGFGLYVGTAGNAGLLEQFAYGTGVFAALGNAINGASGLVSYSGQLGTPTQGVLTNATGLPAATGVANGALPAGVTINNGNWSGTALAASNIAPSGSSGQLQYNNSGALGASYLWEKTNVINQVNSTNPQQLIIYETSDNPGPATTNYAYGFIDAGVTTANTFTFGETQGGTGVLGNMQFTVQGTNILDYALTTANTWTFSKSAKFPSITTTSDAIINSITVGLGVSGSDNIAVGRNTLPSSATGTENTAFGNGTLSNLTSGVYNLAIGLNALNANTSGAFNAGIGASALTENTTGDYNFALGYGALSQNTTGGFNVGVGASALLENTTGGYNIALGFDALAANTTGYSNTAVGHGSLQSVNGSSNSALGYYSGANATGGGNTFLGAVAGYDVTTGHDNTIIGHQVTVGTGITTGSNNILIGLDLQILTPSSDNQLNIGNLIFGTGLTSGNTISTGKVGIGTSTPSTILEVNGSTKSTAYIAGGTSPTLTSGTCSGSSAVGGSTVGAFTAATCTAGTYILSGLPTATNGYVCEAHDETTTADTLVQTAYTTTSATLKSTTVNNDVVVFLCMGF